MSFISILNVMCLNILMTLDVFGLKCQYKATAVTRSMGSPSDYCWKKKKNVHNLQSAAARCSDPLADIWTGQTTTTYTIQFV